MSYRPYVQWETANNAEMAFVDQQIASKRGMRTLLQRRLFATVRPTFDSSGLSDASGGYVVTRQTFDDVTHFATKEEAVLYVNSLAALELP